MTIKNYGIQTLFVIIICLSSLMASSQHIANERIAVHINKHLFFNESILKYKVYLTPIKKPEEKLSDIVYFELSDIHNVPKLQWKSSLKNNMLSDEIKIPDKLESGYYIFRAYTNKLRSNPEKVYSTPIIIQRIFEDIKDTLIINPTHINKEFNLVADKKTFLESQIIKDSLSTINKYLLDISIPAEHNFKSANVSISLTEKSNFDSLTILSKPIDFLETEYENSLNTSQFTESGFTIINGIISNKKDSTPLANKTVYLFFNDSLVHFKFCITTGKGEFCFALDSSYNNRKIFLQLVDVNFKNENVIWQVDDKSLALKYNSDTLVYLLDYKQKNYLQKLQKRELVNAVFNPVRINTKTHSQNGLKQDLYYKASYSIKPSDYMELDDFKDICDNILPSVRYRKTDDKISLGLVMENQQLIYENVLVIVNGSPCFNMEYVSRLRSKEIKQIDIFNSILMYGNLTFNGIISIHTYNAKVNKQMLNTPYYVFKNTFHIQEIKYPNESSNNPKILPDLYWNPELVINKENAIKIALDKAQIGSEYRLIIKGLTENGELIFIEKEINFDLL